MRSRAFEYVVMAVIVANVVAMACEYEGIEQSPEDSRRYRGAMLLFSLFYYAEVRVRVRVRVKVRVRVGVRLGLGLRLGLGPNPNPNPNPNQCILKLIGLGPRNYFDDRWCRFDFFLVCASLLDQFFFELLMTVRVRVRVS